MTFDSSRIEKNPTRISAEQLAGEQRSDLLHAAEEAQQPVEHQEDEAQKPSPNTREERRAAARCRARPTSCRARAVSHFGHEQVQRRRIGQPTRRAMARVTRDRRSAATSLSAARRRVRHRGRRRASRAAFSPVSRRKICFEARRARRRRSRAARPSCRSARITPPCMIAMRSHIASATSSVCVDIMIVLPRRVYSRNRSLRMRAALGSSPTIGSSTTITSGRCTNALEMMSFCRMPWL